MLSVKEAIIKSNRNVLLDECIKTLSFDIDVEIEKERLSTWLDYVLTLKEQRDEDILIVINKNVGTFLDEKDYEYMDASIVHKEDLKEEDIKIPNIKEDNIWKMTEEEANSSLLSLSIPQGYAFELSDWEEILGYSVPQCMINIYGLETTMACVIYEMTFFGYEREDMEEKREEVHQRVDEIIEVLKKPQEEQDKYFVPSEEVFKELGVEKETDDEHLNMMCSMLVNKLRNAKALAQIKKEVEDKEKNG